MACSIWYSCFLTDVDKGEILELIHRNIKRNEDLLKAQICVKEIDFYNHATIDDLQADKKDVSIILAADGMEVGLILSGVVSLLCSVGHGNQKSQLC